MRGGDQEAPVQPQGPPGGLWPLDAQAGGHPAAEPFPLQEAAKGPHWSPGEAEGLPLGHSRGAGHWLPQPHILCVRQLRRRGSAEEADKREREGREGTQA